jgi:hypothetical protein
MLLNWANYEIENTPLDTNYYYRIELDTIGNGSFFGVDSVGNGILQKEVFNLPNADTLIFRVIIIVPQGCDPSRARIATSRSNIKNTSRITRLDYLNKIDITVKPNPVQNSFYISGDFVYGKEITIKMFDMNGRLIYNKWIDGKSRLNENIDMKNFVNGLYQLQLSGVDFLINKKIVKTN